MANCGELDVLLPVLLRDEEFWGDFPLDRPLLDVRGKFLCFSLWIFLLSLFDLNLIEYTVLSYSALNYTKAGLDKKMDITKSIRLSYLFMRSTSSLSIF